VFFFYDKYFYIILLRIWARSVCINENLNLGSVLPFLKMAKERDMQVIIMNPNERLDPISRDEIPEFSSMEKHCKYVWREIIGKLNFSNEIYIVAHSMGGYCLNEILSDGINTDRICKIAFTDSVHGSRMKLTINKQRKLYYKLEYVNSIFLSLRLSTFLYSNYYIIDFIKHILEND